MSHLCSTRLKNIVAINAALMFILQHCTYFSAIVWPIHTVHLFTRQTKRILSLQRQGFSLPYATGEPWHNGHLTYNYRDQTTRANWPVIIAIIQRGRTPTPHRHPLRSPKANPSWCPASVNRGRSLEPTPAQPAAVPTVAAILSPNRTFSPELMSNMPLIPGSSQGTFTCLTY